MKRSIWLLLFCFTIDAAVGQYYLRGEIKDERGLVLEGARIQLSSKGSVPYFSGNTGSFGIPVSKTADTIHLSMAGYEDLRKAVDTRQFQVLTMKMLPSTFRLYKHRLSSVTTDLHALQTPAHAFPGESYSNLVENDFIETKQYPQTGFALNVDKAAYSNIRRFINNDMRVPPNAVRIEEMLNYFSFPVPLPDSAVHRPYARFSCNTLLTNCPWKKESQLLFLHITAPVISLENIPASNLVFLIDVSGSMDKPNRLPLLQSAFKLLVNHLRAQDTITIVTYGGGVGIALPATSGAEKKRINDAIDSLHAGGDTPGAGAIKTAYEMAQKTFIPAGNNRVILATDGDFNVGQRSEQELEYIILSYRHTGIYLSCLGVGMGNYKDSKLEILSKKGNGNFAYLDRIQEAEKVLVTEFTKTLFSVANNAFFTVHFFPELVRQYRLIGFENKKDALEDSTSELEGGEIGSGHSVMAIFELSAANDDPLLFNRPLADISLQYKLPENEDVLKQSFIALNRQYDLDTVDSVYRFAVAVTMFGSLLRQSKFTKDYRYEDVLLLAHSAVNNNDMLQKEFLALVEKTMKLYYPGKKRRR